MAMIEYDKLATDVALRAINSAIGAGGRLLKDYWEKHKARDASVYADYLKRKSVQANSVRSFVFDSKEFPLYEVFVPMRIKDGGISEDNLLELLCGVVDDPAKRPARAIAVVGQAGTGKSLLMKHAFFKVQEIDSKRIPVLMEVRSFNRVRLGSIEDRILDDFESVGASITQSQIVNGLKSGILIILFDGIDELKGAIQGHYENEIKQFMDKYPSCPVLVSSRPDLRIRSLSLDVRAIAPLDIDQIEELLYRLPFEATIKKEFISLVNSRLFRSHYEFVSVPLLCIIMVLTFAVTGQVANRKHEFFEDAFSALWSRHDGLKPGYERHRYTGLQKTEFLRLVSAFAASSYSSGDLNMRESHIRRHFRDASQLSGVNCKETDFVRDITTSTSIALQDGPYLRFCHLSFHEYFVAVFICETADAYVDELIEEFSDRLETDSVLPMILSMNPEKIEFRWVTSKLAIINDHIGRLHSDAWTYAFVAADGCGSAQHVSSSMRKIRLLYEFRPTTSDLRAAFDAERRMNSRSRRMPAMSLAIKKMFDQDRANFERLARKLNEKYAGRSSALQELLHRSQQASR